MKNIKYYISVFLILLVLISVFSGCTQSTRQTVFENLAYGENERQIMDLYLPETTKTELPLVVIIHGGQWIEGDKSTYSPEAKSYCDQFGVAAASINYRYVSDSVQMKMLMDDIGAALAQISKTANEQGITITKCALTGHSSGGHMALLYSYSRKDTSPIPLAFVKASSAPTDLMDDGYFGPGNVLGKDRVEMLFSLAIGKKVTQETIGECSTQIKADSPLYHVNDQTVPTLLMHGKRDALVPYSNAVSLDAKLTEYGIAHDFISYPTSSHGLDNDPDCTQKADAIFAAYIQEYLF